MSMFSAETLFLQKGLKPALNPNYKLFTYEQLIVEVEKAAKDAAEIIGFSTENSKILLHHFKWDAINLTEKFFEAASPKSFLQKNGIVLLDDSNSDDLIVIEKCYACNGMKEIPVIFSCSHMICLKCWKNAARFARSINTDQSIPPSLKCIPKKCETSIPETFILQLFNDPETYEIYQELIVNSFIALQSNFKCCPNRKNGCDKAVKIESDSKVEEITCECGFTFCFSCEDIPHSPFPCIFSSKIKAELITYVAQLADVSLFCDVCHKDITNVQRDSGRAVCQCGYTFKFVSKTLEVKTSNPRLKDYQSQYEIFEREYKQLRDLDDIKDDEDDNMVFIKLSLRCLHNFRQQILPFYAFLHFLHPSSNCASINVLLPLAEDALKTATLTGTFPLNNHQFILSDSRKTDNLNALATLKTRVDSLLKCYQDEDVWKFKDKDIEMALYNKCSSDSVTEGRASDEWKQKVLLQKKLKLQWLKDRENRVIPNPML